MLGWGFLEVGGWYRRLTYYFAAVLAILTSTAIFYSQVDRASSPLLRFAAGVTWLTLLSIVPITYRLLLERMLKIPVAPFQDLPGSERDILLQAVNRFWQIVQERIAVIAGERTALKASSAASRASSAIRFGISEVTLESNASTDLEELAEDLNHSLSAASRIWLAACGTAGVSNAGAASFMALDWERRNTFAQYLLRPGGWWTRILSKGVQNARIDPQSFFKHRPIFSQLTPDQQRVALSKLRSHHFKPGETVVQQGDCSGRLFIITDGQAEVASESILDGPGKTILRSEDTFGQTAFLAGKPHTATVCALDDLWVFYLDRSDVPDLIPEILKKIPSGIGEKKMARISKIPLFKAFSPIQLEILAERAHYVSYPSGSTIIQEGEDAKEFYVIDEGSVEISRDGEKLAILGAGEYFGEIGLLLSLPRTATVTAATDCKCIQVSCEEFKRLLSESNFHHQLTRVAERRA
jgi:CRP-like cAMP-binding protein